jgi:hypothetical protein
MGRKERIPEACGVEQDKLEGMLKMRTWRRRGPPGLNGFKFFRFTEFRFFVLRYPVMIIVTGVLPAA